MPDKRKLTPAELARFGVHPDDEEEQEERHTGPRRYYPSKWNTGGAFVARILGGVGSGVVGAVPSFVTTPAAAAIGAGAETLAQRIESPDDLDKSRIGLEAGLSAFPISKIYKLIKAGSSAKKQIAANMARGAGLVEAGNIARRGTEEYTNSTNEDRDFKFRNLAPRSPTEFAFDAGTSLVGGLAGLFSRNAVNRKINPDEGPGKVEPIGRYIDPKKDAVTKESKSVEASVNVKNASDDLPDDIGIDRSNFPDLLTKKLPDNLTLGIDKSKLVRETGAKVIPVPQKIGMRVAARNELDPREAAVVGPVRKIVDDVDELGDEAAAVSRATHELDEFAEDSPRLKDVLAKIERDYTVDKAALYAIEEAGSSNPKVRAQFKELEEARDAAIVKARIAENRLLGAREKKVQKAEQTADLQNTRVEMGGTDLRKIQAAEAAKKAKDVMADSVQRAKNLAAMEAKQKEMTADPEFDEVVAAASIKKTLPTMPKPVIPITDPDDVARMRYGKEHEVLHAIAGSGKRGVPKYLKGGGRKKWIAIFEDDKPKKGPDTPDVPPVAPGPPEPSPPPAPAGNGVIPIKPQGGPKPAAPKGEAPPVAPVTQVVEPIPTGRKEAGEAPFTSPTKTPIGGKFIIAAKDKNGKVTIHVSNNQDSLMGIYNGWKMSGDMYSSIGAAKVSKNMTREELLDKTAKQYGAKPEDITFYSKPGSDDIPPPPAPAPVLLKPKPKGPAPSTAAEMSRPGQGSRSSGNSSVDARLRKQAAKDAVKPVAPPQDAVIPGKGAVAVADPPVSGSDKLKADMEAYKARKIELGARVEQEGGLIATLPNGNQLMLHKSLQPGSKWRVTTFDKDNVPSGHREYSQLGNEPDARPMDSALGEFSGKDLTFRELPKVTKPSVIPVKPTEAPPVTKTALDSETVAELKRWSPTELQRSLDKTKNSELKRHIETELAERAGKAAKPAPNTPVKPSEAPPVAPTATGKATDTPPVVKPVEGELGPPGTAKATADPTNPRIIAYDRVPTANMGSIIKTLDDMGFRAIKAEPYASDPSVMRITAMPRKGELSKVVAEPTNPITREEFLAHVGDPEKNYAAADALRVQAQRLWETIKDQIYIIRRKKKVINPDASAEANNTWKEVDRLRSQADELTRKASQQQQAWADSNSHTRWHIAKNWDIPEDRLPAKFDPVTNPAQPREPTPKPKPAPKPTQVTIDVTDATKGVNIKDKIVAAVTKFRNEVERTSDTNKLGNLEITIPNGPVYTIRPVITEIDNVINKFNEATTSSAFDNLAGKFAKAPSGIDIPFSSPGAQKPIIVSATDAKALFLDHPTNIHQHDKLVGPTAATMTHKPNAVVVTKINLNDASDDLRFYIYRHGDDGAKSVIVGDETSLKRLAAAYKDNTDTKLEVMELQKGKTWKEAIDHQVKSNKVDRDKITIGLANIKAEIPPLPPVKGAAPIASKVPAKTPIANVPAAPAVKLATELTRDTAHKGYMIRKDSTGKIFIEGSNKDGEKTLISYAKSPDEAKQIIDDLVDTARPTPIAFSKNQVPVHQIYIKHQQLAAKWLEWNNRKVTEKNLVSVMERNSAELLTEMLAKRGIKEKTIAAKVPEAPAVKSTTEPIAEVPSTPTHGKLSDLALKEKEAWDKYFDIKKAILGPPSNNKPSQEELRAAGKAAGEIKAELAKAVKAAQEAGENIPAFIRTKPETPSATVKTPPGKGLTSDDLTKMDSATQEIEINKAVEAFKKGKDKTTDETGAAGLELLVQAGLASTGAAIGMAANPDDPLTGAMLGGAIGIGAPMAVRAVLRHLDAKDLSPKVEARSRQDLGKFIKDNVRTAEEMIADYYRASLLTKPDNLVMNAWAGPYGAALMGALEAGMAGDPRGWKALKLLGPVRFTKKMAGSWEEAKTRIHDASERTEGNIGEAGPMWFRKGVSLPAEALTAGDISARKLLMQAGFSETEARAFTLTSEPFTTFGKATGNFSKTKGAHGHRSFIIRMALPFYRTNMNQIEQQLVRFPIPGVGNYLRGRWGVQPVSWRTEKIQAAMTLGTGGLGYLIGSLTPLEYQKPLLKLISNFGGVYGTGAAVAFVAGASSQRDNPLTKQVFDAAMDFLNNGMALPNVDLGADIVKMGYDLYNDPKANIKLPYGAIPPFVSTKERWGIPAIASRIGNMSPSARTTKDEHIYKTDYWTDTIKEKDYKPKAKSKGQLAIERHKKRMAEIRKKQRAALSPE